MNLVHEPVHVPMAMSRSQTGTADGLQCYFGLAGRKMCFQTVRTGKGAQSHVTHPVELCICHASTAWYVQLVPYVTRPKLDKTTYI